MVECNKGKSKECDVEISESDYTEKPESVPVKPLYMEIRKKLEY